MNMRNNEMTSQEKSRTAPNKIVLWIALGLVLLCLLVFGAMRLFKPAVKELPPMPTTLLGNSVTVVDEGRETSFTLDEMMDWHDTQFIGQYSAINNWPSKHFYAAWGVLVSEVLSRAGVNDDWLTLTVSAPDGFGCTFTKEQFESPRHYYPGLLEDGPDSEELLDGEYYGITFWDGPKIAIRTEMILAYGLAKDGNLGEAAASIQSRQGMDLLFGQTHIGDQNNIGFVSDVYRLEISRQEPEHWSNPSTYPLDGPVAKGTAVNLEQKEMSGGFAKIYYTRDGSDPDESSLLYNPSTYQPELNGPIIIEEDTIIKAVVKGLGKYDSEIKTFEFTIK
jgi:hypothetical protein